MSSTLTRRAALLGAVASSAALAVPAAAAVGLGELPWAKARRLSRELSDVLAEIAITEGGWRAIVEPAGNEWAIQFEDVDNTPVAVMESRFRHFANAVKLVDPAIAGASVSRDIDTGAIIDFTVKYHAPMAFAGAGAYVAQVPGESTNRIVYARADIVGDDGKPLTIRISECRDGKMWGLSEEYAADQVKLYRKVDA